MQSEATYALLDRLKTHHDCQNVDPFILLREMMDTSSLMNLHKGVSPTGDHHF